jgi:hypothetical protein
MTRRSFLPFVFLCMALTLEAQDKTYQWILNMMSKEKNVRQEAATNLLQLKDASFAPAMVDVLFYMPRSARGEMIEILQKTTGEKIGESYYDWVEFVGRRADIKSPPGYVKFKVALLSLIDPTYKKILYTGVFTKIRPEEIVWGGVKLDGIPPIDAPAFIGVAEAKLKENEKIFGVSLKGEARAYPLRYLSWHEMLNDRIAGEPITISY